MRNPNKYKAIVEIRGSTSQTVYGKNPQKLLARAIRILTRNEPGFAGFQPEKVILLKELSDTFKPLSWQVVSETTYESLTPEQHEWRKQ